jgi:AAA domain
MDIDKVDRDESESFPPFVPARFASELRLPPAGVDHLTDAARAVREEYRDSSRWKRMRCHKVSVYAERDRGTVFVIHVGKLVEFDWTWEGATAFRPATIDDACSVPDAAADHELYDNEVAWRGEVLEVDEQNGCLFVSMDNPEAAPAAGLFFVRPFEFLAVLNSLFNEPAYGEIRKLLPSRLNAAAGGVHPQVRSSAPTGLPQLQPWWKHAWSILWGPPGTGKTWTTGQQIAALLADPTERILIVSTTNKATDAVAISLGEAARCCCPDALEKARLLRIGKGASFGEFSRRNLGSMLQGTESGLHHRIEELADRLRQEQDREQKALSRMQLSELRAMGDKSRRRFVDPDVQVVVATAFRATTSLRDPVVSEMVSRGEAPFTTICIDEAGLMSRAAIAALSLLAARRVVLVGDSRQLAPISRISRILPSRQQRWLASSGLSHLETMDNPHAAVHVLTEQRRMHPDVCKVVSTYQYGGALTTASDVVNRGFSLPDLLKAFSRTIWYVLDEESPDLASIRAERGPGNKSWSRPITVPVLEKLFAGPDIRTASGLFVSPFRAQSRLVAEWLAARKMKLWEASTVHSQQGSEADIVVFDTVNATNCVWQIDEWQRLVNVGLSRAREAIILMASRSEMEEPFLRPLVSLLKPGFLVHELGKVRWERTSAKLDGERLADRVGEPEVQYGKASSTFGSQISSRKKMSPVLSRDQQRLTGLRLDGKPRLVRGVAGSGKSLVLCNWLVRTVQRLKPEDNSAIWAVYANRSLQKLLREAIESAWEGLFAGELFARPGFPWEKVRLLHVRDVLAGILPGASLSMDDFDFDYDRAAEEFLGRTDIASLLPRCHALFIDEAQDMGSSTLRLLLSLVEQGDKADPNSRAAHIFFDNAQNIYGRKPPKWSEFGLDMRGRSTILRESFRSTRPITELAVNVLHRLTPEDQPDDQKELVDAGLIRNTRRGGEDWLEVRFSEVNGPAPVCQLFDSRERELATLASHLKHLIFEEKILPRDITLIYVSDAVAEMLERGLAGELASSGVELSLQKNRAFDRRDNTLLVTTPHSYKGYESEVVLIPCIDQYVTTDGRILACPLYVAMTRARSLLAMYGTRSQAHVPQYLLATISRSAELLRSPREE